MRLRRGRINFSKFVRTTTQSVFRPVRLYIVFTLLLFAALPTANAQKVGLVLSGGGATGMSHIGVLKALEQHHIPIDYIAGTSMGAVISALYASGYSPEEIEKLVESERFRKMAEGGLEDEHLYFFKQKEHDPSLITVRFNVDSILQTSIPTNVISPVALDFQLLELFMGPAAEAQYNFDSLFIPYRCVASDIAAKQEVVFRNGRLTEAVRASMSYPFYIKPIKVNGKLMFDGGLYNNFPTDVMYNDFFPDIIIGSNVSDKLESPDSDNLISQVMNMLLRQRDFSMMCENGILIEPKPDVATFDFSGRSVAIDAGFDATMLKMDSIQLLIDRRSNPDSLAERRAAYRRSLPELVVDKVEITGLNRIQTSYVRRILQKRNSVLTVDELKPKYFRMFADDKIQFTYPRANFNESTGYYDLHIEVNKERDIIVDFGGNFSSRPINTGYVGLKYQFLGQTGMTLQTNSYFGRFYGSVHASARFDFPTKLQFYIEPEYTRNRWDYFRSQATFFEDVKPSFLVKYENFGGIKVGMPVKNKGRLKADFKVINLRNEYYQTDNFTSVDTADVTSFRGQTVGLLYERSTLNRTQYSNEGTSLTLSSRYVFGREETLHGSTKPESEPLVSIDVGHDWWQFRLTYENYFAKLGKHMTLGFHTEGVYTNMPFFSNYTATILAAPAFRPIPENLTLFQEQFRAHAYATVGLRDVISITKNIDVRLEGYAFQPYETILTNESNSASYSTPISNRYFIGSSALVIHSPLGPVSFSVNYYDFNKEEPWSVLFNFGYLIHNRKALQ